MTGVENSGRAVVSVGFVNSGGGPAVYSATQACTIDATGQSSGSVTIAADATGSSSGVVTASLGTSTLSFGPYTLTLDVSS